ncbi:T9SS type A sorting domain-containing protein [Flavobacterium sp. LaA7.5]|nr:T9SS type A sorting domain-containing protein [Flavobacterium salilacus subsp. altitudinum]
MKNLYLFSSLLLSLICYSQTIDIPDANFKAKLLSGFHASLSADGNNYNSNVDANNNGEIEVEEALAVTGLKLSTSPANTNGDIYSLEGIEYFTNLKYLLFVGNQVSGDFDATVFPNLIELNCSNNNLTGIVVNGLNQLTILKFHDNEVNELNTEGLENLETLFFRGNNISSIALGNSVHLKNIYIDFNNITTLDLSMLQELEVVLCSGNNINQLILGSNPLLAELSASGNSITTINLEGLSSLNYLNLSSNSLSQIDVSVVPQMKLLYIGSNPLTEIDLTESSDLEYLEINNTQVSEIDCSQTSVIELQTSDNPNLTYINVKNGVISTSDPDLLYFAFWFENLPMLGSICIDNGEQNNLPYTNYNMNGNVVVYTGENCDIVAAPAGLNDNERVQYKVYPNPTASVLNIENNSGIIVQKLSIYNTLGQLVREITYPDDKLQVNISDFEAGTYIIKIFSDSFTTTQKFIKK